MKQIEAFVDSVYQHVGGNEQEIQELKAEMKSHLLEAVDELKREGKSEQEAIAIAIDRFGGEKEMRAVVGQLFTTQKIFAKRVLSIAVTIFVLTSIACGVLWAVDNGHRKENLAVAEQIVGMLGKKEAISDDMKQDIKTLVHEKEQIVHVQIYHMDDVKRETETGIHSCHRNEAIPAYQYEKSVSAPDWMLMDLGYDIGGADWYVHMESKRIFPVIPFVFFVGAAISATLFTIWASINAYHHGRLHMGWILVFAFCNVLGYLVYEWMGKRAARNEWRWRPLHE